MVSARLLRSGQKGGDEVGLTKRGKGSRIMAVVDANGLPIGLRVLTAGEHEVKQAEDTILECWTVELPERTIADRAFDSDALDQSLAEFGVEVIAPHRKNRRPENKTQDGRKLRRYKRRWKVERFFAWLGNFRRLLIRHERKVRNYEGFAHLATLIILVRNCF
jgi:transposase